MKQLLIKYWWRILIFIIILLLFPLILNLAVTRDSIFDCKIAGEPKDWLSLWIIYFSALTSLAMVVITGYTLKQNKEQLEEMKKEREEDLHERKENQRARLVFDIITYRRGYYLRIRNIGKENAFNVSITVDEEFIQNIAETNQVIFEEMKTPFYVPIDIPKYFYIGECNDIVKRWIKNIPLSLCGTYCDNYQIKEDLDMYQFIGKLQYNVNDELTTAFKEFTDGQITQNNAYNAIQEGLDSIANNIKKYVDYISEKGSNNEDKK